MGVYNAMVIIILGTVAVCEREFKCGSPFNGCTNPLFSSATVPLIKFDWYPLSSSYAE